MAAVPATDEWLSGPEADTLAGLRYAKRRSDWRLGRWTAKRAVAAYRQLRGGSCVLMDLEIRAADSGEPQLFNQGRLVPLALSISHSTGLAACVLAPDTIGLGCDLERIEARCEGFVDTYFTPAEQHLIAHAPANDRPLITTLVWSAKESALKALHTGLRLDTHAVQVELGSSGGVWRPLRVLHTEGAQWIHGWWRCFGPSLFTVAALAELRVPVGLREGVSPTTMPCRRGAVVGSRMALTGPLAPD